MSPGVRFDRFDADAVADDIYLTGNPGSPTPEDYSDSQATAKIGALYNFTDTVSIYARLSQGFRAPPYDDVNVGFTNFLGGYKTIGLGKDEADIDASAPRLASPGYGIVDVLAHLNIGQRVRLNAGLFNVTDKTYMRWGDTAGIGNDAPARFTQPGLNAGLTFRIEL